MSFNQREVLNILIQISRTEPERFEKELIRLFTILSEEKEASKRFHRKEIFKPPEVVYKTYLEETEAEYELKGLEQGFQKGIMKGIQKAKFEIRGI